MFKLSRLWGVLILSTGIGAPAQIAHAEFNPPLEIIELDGPCAAVDGKFPDDPRCHEIAEFSVIPQIRMPFFSMESAGPPALQQRSQVPGRSPGTPGMQEVREIMNALDWFWRFLEKNQAGLKVNTKNSANAIPSDPACKAWDAMGGWHPVPKAIPYVMVAKNGYGFEVVRLEYTIQFTYGGRCQGKGQYLQNVRLVYGHAAASLFFTAEVDAEIGDIVNFGTPEHPIAGIQIMSHNRVRSLVKNISSSNAYYVRGDGLFYEVMPHQIMGAAPHALMNHSEDDPLAGDGYRLLDLTK